MSEEEKLKEEIAAIRKFIKMLKPHQADQRSKFRRQLKRAMNDLKEINRREK